MLDGDLNSRGGLTREEVRRLLEALAGRTPEVHVSLDDVKPRGLNDDIVENDPWNTHSVPFP